ncbi:MAG: CTP synthase, partial [Candidatus Moraniibacteriota bacterium]
GVMSGVGKGVAASSIGKILQARGLTVTAIKIDPYINVDAGTMNPTEHGEVFVLADGYETDQDMGNYERFMGLKLSRDNYMTTGSVYQRVIERERNLEYHGKCVEVVPHIPLEVIGTIKRAAEKVDADVTIIEIGGTIGEYQNILFLESARMLKNEQPGDVLFVLVSYLPIPNKIGEMKTKPTQYAARTLNSAGIQADFIIARAERPLDERRKEKIAVSCSMRPESVISAPDVESIYDVPVNFEKDHLSDVIIERLHLKSRKSVLAPWKKKVSNIKHLKRGVKIAVVGKYFKTGDFVLSDAYISVIESLKHAAFANHRKPELTWIDATEYEKDPKKLRELAGFDGVLIPGGFGARGVEGKILAIEYCRKKKIPYFGICYGMQLAVIEYARHVAGLAGANTAEVDSKSPHLVIDVMPEQKAKIAKKEYGGTMRLGEYTAVLKKGTLAEAAYGTRKIIERHRHRYEVNPEYVVRLSEAGMVFSGTSPDGVLMEIVELPRREHPFFVGVQFHPEFQSSILAPQPVFNAFIQAAVKHRKK